MHRAKLRRNIERVRQPALNEEKASVQKEKLQDQLEQDSQIQQRRKDEKRAGDSDLSAWLHIVASNFAAEQQRILTLAHLAHLHSSAQVIQASYRCWMAREMGGHEESRIWVYTFEQALQWRESWRAARRNRRRLRRRAGSLLTRWARGCVARAWVCRERTRLAREKAERKHLRELAEAERLRKLEEERRLREEEERRIREEFERAEGGSAVKQRRLHGDGRWRWIGCGEKNRKGASRTLCHV